MQQCVWQKGWHSVADVLDFNECCMWRRWLPLCQWGHSESSVHQRMLLHLADCVHHAGGVNRRVHIASVSMLKHCDIVQRKRLEYLHTDEHVFDPGCVQWKV